MEIMYELKTVYQVNVNYKAYDVRFDDLYYNSQDLTIVKYSYHDTLDECHSRQIKDINDDDVYTQFVKVKQLLAKSDNIYIDDDVFYIDGSVYIINSWRVVDIEYTVNEPENV